RVSRRGRRSSARAPRRTRNEAPGQDLRHLRVGRPLRGLEGRQAPVPIRHRAREDPAEPALRGLRPAPADAEHRDQARPAARDAPVHPGPRRLTVAPPDGGPPRARGILGPALLLAAYLLAAWPVHMGFFFLPLAGLLALAHPRSLREYGWL